MGINNTFNVNINDIPPQTVFNHPHLTLSVTPPEFNIDRQKDTNIIFTFTSLYIFFLKLLHIMLSNSAHLELEWRSLRAQFCFFILMKYPDFENGVILVHIFIFLFNLLSVFYQITL